MLLGIPGIIKPSKADTLIPSKVVRAILDAGYPKNGLTLLFFNSNNPISRQHNFRLCDEASIIWPFGDDSTVDNLLRLEQQNVFQLEKFLSDKKISDFKKDFDKFVEEIKQAKYSIADYLTVQTIDHFSSKHILRHASGRCAGILDNDFDVDLAVDLIIESSMRYPIGCNSMKSIFVVKEAYNELVKKLRTRFAYLDKHTGNPMSEDTEVGYVASDTVAFIEKRLGELQRAGLIDVLCGGKKINDFQLTPILASTNDINSELLLTEIPGYILCLKKADSFRDAVSEINNISVNNPKLAVSFFTNNQDNMKLHINAHHLKINYLTTDIDGIVHEGNDYIMQLTKPYMVHIHKEYTKKHPYLKE